MNPYLLGSSIVLLSLSACRKDREISVYTVDADKPANPHQTANPHGNSLPPVQMPGQGETPDPHGGMAVLQTVEISDEAPTHWQEKKRTAMRMASYQLDGDDGAVADISFTRLQSVPGSLLNNLNRWREQLAQPHWTEEKMRESVATTQTFFGAGVVIDIEGILEQADPKKDGRILGVVAEKDGSAWYYKMRGNAQLVGSEKVNFLKWVESVKLEETVEPPPPIITRKEVTWTLPEGWSDGDTSKSRYATIMVPSADGSSSSIAVSFFPGDVGGDAANVNRWRGQVGLQAMGEKVALATIQSVASGDKTLNLVDLKGAKQRMLAAWVRHGDHTWFFKWSGTDAELEARKAEFHSFLQTIRFNAAQ